MNQLSYVSSGIVLTLSSVAFGGSTVSAQAAPKLETVHLDHQAVHQAVVALKQELPSLESPASAPVDTAPAIGDPADLVYSSPAPLQDGYILGTGDVLRIDVFGAPDYSGEWAVLTDGFLNLPVVGRINVRGLTLAQASDAISRQYAPYIRRPLVTVTPLSLRPVRIALAGEVQRPGTYTIPIEGENGSNRFPTLTDAIQLAGGISSQADVRQIEINRQQRTGATQTITANLWDLLQSGDMNGDIPLQSGDTIVVPEAESLAAQEAVELGAASFSPEAVNIYVVGEVVNPGGVELPPNTPLNQAILAAGGFDAQRANRDEVILVRLNENGTVTERPINIDFTEGINDEVNPLLKEDDVVVVQRSGLAGFSDTANLAVSPIGRILNGILGVFRLF